MAVRRISALAGVAVAAIGLTVACGRGGAPAETPAPGPATSAAAATQKTATPTDAASDEAIRELLAPWKGDLDGMVERRYVRMLVTFSKTNYSSTRPRSTASPTTPGSNSKTR